jgi:phosphopantothenoylcysteine decarboxylase / phosphopantothenate---cysteine ligase
MQKLERKNCDLIVVNGPDAVHAPDTQVEVLDKDGQVLDHFSGGKGKVAQDVFGVIRRALIHSRPERREKSENAGQPEGGRGKSEA